MKKDKRLKLLEQLSKIPNISLACDKLSLSRNTIYRWCKEDPEFKKDLDYALELGSESVSDLAESKLVSHINNGNLRAIQYWLDNNKRTYVRPRPKFFWEEILRKENPVSEIKITMIPPEQAQKFKESIGDMQPYPEEVLEDSPDEGEE